MEFQLPVKFEQHLFTERSLVNGHVLWLRTSRLLKNGSYKGQKCHHCLTKKARLLYEEEREQTRDIQQEVVEGKNNALTFLGMTI